MKHALAAILLSALVSSISLLIAGPQTSESSTSPGTNNSIASKREIFPPKEEKWRWMSDHERLRLLERLGQLPEYAEMPRDWHLAEKTSWWGRPLDAKEFWKDRVLWLDEAATSAARRHGRCFPPMPYKDPTLPHYENDKDTHENEGTIEGPNLDIRWTSEERAFWTKFVETHPHPPEELEQKQLQVAEGILGARFDFEQRGNPGRLTSEFLAEGEQIEKARALDMGYPKEAFTEGALNAAYVLRMKRAYQALIDQGNAPDGAIVKNFLTNLVVDPKTIIAPLTDDQVQAANAWKIAYLQRLQQEHVDQSYIDAYQKTWNLPPAALSNGSKQP